MSHTVGVHFHYGPPSPCGLTNPAQLTGSTTTHTLLISHQRQGLVVGWHSYQQHATNPTLFMNFDQSKLKFPH